MNKGSRFQDEGRSLWHFMGYFLVRCPQCDRRARVEPRASGAPRSTCVHCGYARDQGTDPGGWRGPVHTRWAARCGTCGRPVQKFRSWAHRPQPPYAMVTCAGCGQRTRLELFKESVPTQRLSEPYDPYFGLPLWLQTPCCGEVLWAFNEEHPAFLADYIAASLREREPNRNSSLASRLPAWMKRAQNRDAVLKCIEHLQRSVE